MELDELTLLRTDFEDTRQLISACLVYFTAQDVSASQQRFGQLKKSHMTMELERVKERLDGVLGDWLLARHLEETEGEEAFTNADLEALAEEGELEELPPEPFGSFQKNRRQTRPVLMEDQAEAEIDYDESEDEDE